MQIARTRLLPESALTAAAPGALLLRDDERLVVQCGDGPLEVVAWREVEPGAD